MFCLKFCELECEEKRRGFGNVFLAFKLARKKSDGLELYKILST